MKITHCYQPLLLVIALMAFSSQTLADLTVFLSINNQSKDTCRITPVSSDYTFRERHLKTPIPPVNGHSVTFFRIKGSNIPDYASTVLSFQCGNRRIEWEYTLDNRVNPPRIIIWNISHDKSIDIEYEDHYKGMKTIQLNIIEKNQSEFVD